MFREENGIMTPQTKKEDKQDISIQKTEGTTVDAKNYKINNLNVYNININSDLIETKKFEDSDKDRWENEETVISVEDINMIKEIIQKEEEIKETLPILEKFKLILNFLPKTQKGLLITALLTIIREDRLSKKLYGGGGNINEFDDEIIGLLKEEEENENYRKTFTLEIYDDYKKIYNLIRCKDLERKVIPFIQKLIKTTTGDEEIKAKFQKYWYSRLDYHPYCIFVNSVNEKWKIEILNKFDNKEKEQVRVYARDSIRTKFAKKICDEIAEIKGIKIKINQYYLGSQIAFEIVFC